MPLVNFAKMRRTRIRAALVPIITSIKRNSTKRFRFGSWARYRRSKNLIYRWTNVACVSFALVEIQYISLATPTYKHIILISFLFRYFALVPKVNTRTRCPFKHVIGSERDDENSIHFDFLCFSFRPSGV